MASANSETHSWQDVPERFVGTWRHIFDQSTSGLDLDEPCLVCGTLELHRWFRSSVTIHRRWKRRALNRGGCSGRTLMWHQLLLCLLTVTALGVAGVGAGPSIGHTATTTAAMRT